MMKAMDEIEVQIMATRNALVDADKEFGTTVALLIAIVKDSQYFGLIGQLGTARELRDQLKELISTINYLGSGECCDDESIGRVFDQFDKLETMYHRFITSLFEMSVFLTNAGQYALSRVCHQVRTLTIQDFAEIMFESD